MDQKKAVRNVRTAFASTSMNRAGYYLLTEVAMDPDEPTGMVGTAWPSK